MKKSLESGDLSGEGAFFAAFGKRREVGSQDLKIDAPEIDGFIRRELRPLLEQEPMKLSQVADIITQRMTGYIDGRLQMIGVLLNQRIH
jgi:hypothetical protein